jgi:hypothetical protein
MKNPSVALQTAYYEALTTPPVYMSYEVWGTSVEVWGVSEVVWSVASMGEIKVYSDMAPTTAGHGTTGSSYIVLNQQTFVDDADKDVYGSEATQGVTVYTSFDGDRGGKKLSSQVADEVMKRIRTRTGLSLAPDFNMITATLDNYITIVEPTPTTTIIRAELRFRHIIEQL